MPDVHRHTGRVPCPRTAAKTRSAPATTRYTPNSSATSTSDGRGQTMATMPSAMATTAVTTTNTRNVLTARESTSAPP